MLLLILASAVAVVIGVVFFFFYDAAVELQNFIQFHHPCRIQGHNTRAGCPNVPSSTDCPDIVVSAKEWGPEGHGFESHESHVGFYSSEVGLL